MHRERERARWREREREREVERERERERKRDISTSSCPMRGVIEILGATSFLRIRNDFSFDHLSSTANPRGAIRGHEGSRGATREHGLPRGATRGHVGCKL